LIESDNNTDVNNNTTPGRKDDLLEMFKEEAMQIDLMSDVPVLSTDSGSCSTAITINGTTNSNATNSGTATIEGTIEVLTLLRTFGEAYRLLSRYTPDPFRYILTWGTDMSAKQPSEHSTDCPKYILIQLGS